MPSSSKKTNTVTDIGKEDLERLRTSDVLQRRKFTAQLASAYNSESTPDIYRRMAENIFRVLIEDVAIEVRKTFSEMIKYSRDIPLDIIDAIARDIDEVSLPILECCETLTEDHIIDIITVSGDNARKLGAIACRPDVTEKVSEALISTKIETVISTLLCNKNADINIQSLDEIVDTFTKNSVIIQDVLNFNNVPIGVVNNITQKVSHYILDSITIHNEEANNAIHKAAKQSEDLVSMRIIGLESNPLDYNTFMNRISSLGMTDEITPIVALSLGKINLLESYLACRLNVSVSNISSLLSDDSNKGFRAIYSEMKLPERLYEATALLLSTLRIMEKKTDSNISTVNIQYTNRIIEKLKFQAENSDVDSYNIDYICSIIRHSQRLFGKS